MCRNTNLQHHGRNLTGAAPALFYSDSSETEGKTPYLFTLVLRDMKFIKPITLNLLVILAVVGIIVTFLSTRIFSTPFAFLMAGSFVTAMCVVHYLNYRLLVVRLFNRSTIHWYILGAIALTGVCVTVLSFVSQLGESAIQVKLSIPNVGFQVERDAAFLVRRGATVAMIMVLFVSTGYSLLIDKEREQESSDTDRFIILRAEGKDHKVLCKDIRFIKAESEYVGYHMNGNRLMVHGSLVNAVTNLKSDGIIRVHRSYAVAKRSITSVGANTITLDDKTEIPVGRSYRPVVRALSLAE